MFGSLAGCVSYQPQRLNTQSTLLNDIAHIRIDRSQMPLPELAAHEFNAEGGLDMMDVAMLAVVNNPDLKVARADAHVSQAQAFAAGLLPDPQFHFGLDFPRNALGAVTAFNMSLSGDINALIQHDANRKAAQDEARKTDLNLLWQEWQVVAKARTLFVRVTQDQRLMEVLAKNRALFADRYDRTQSALDRGTAATGRGHPAPDRASTGSSGAAQRSNDVTAPGRRTCAFSTVRPPAPSSGSHRPAIRLQRRGSALMTYNQAVNAVNSARGELKRIEELFSLQLATQSQVDNARRALQDAQANLLDVHGGHALHNLDFVEA